LIEHEGANQGDGVLIDRKMNGFEVEVEVGYDVS
jgi:hypothetical protein